MKRILVIDDDPVESFITEQILRHVGFPYQLYKAIHGQDGVRMLGEICAENGQCPDIILLDLYMPLWMASRSSKNSRRQILMAKKKPG
jgi:CheY-like chemotaxis protein